MNSAFLSPIGHLARRYPFCAACIVLAMVLAGAGVWLQSDLNDLAARQQQRARDGDRILLSLARGSQLLSELTITRTAVKRINDNLVVEKNVPENFWYFYKIEQDTQVKLADLQQRPAIVSRASTGFKRVPYSLRLTGSFRSDIGFLQRLESGPRFARITSFTMQRQDPSNSNVALIIELEMLGYQ